MIASGGEPNERWTMGMLTPPLVAVGLGALWVGLTYWRPEATFHFVPLIIAVSWPYVARMVEGGRLDRNQSAIAVGGGFAAAIAGALLLAAMGRLEGPTFWGPEGAGIEALAMAILGAIWGTRVVTRTKEGFLTP